MQGPATSEIIVGDISATQFYDKIIVARSTPSVDEEIQEGFVVSSMEMSDTEGERGLNHDSTNSTEGSETLKDDVGNSGSVSPLTSGDDQIVRNKEGHSAAVPLDPADQNTMRPGDAQMTFEDVVRSQLKRDKKGLRADAREFNPCKNIRNQQPNQQSLPQNTANHQSYQRSGHRSDICLGGTCQSFLAQMDGYVVRQIDQIRQQNLAITNMNRAITDKDFTISVSHGESPKSVGTFSIQDELTSPQSKNKEIQQLHHESCELNDVKKFYKHENETLRAEKVAAEKKAQNAERKLQSMEDKSKFNRQLQGTVEEQKGSIENQKATAEKQDNMILDLKADISNRDHELVDLREALARSEEAKKSLEKRLSRVEEKNEKLMCELPDMRALEATNVKLLREKGELEKTVAKLKAHKSAVPKLREASKNSAKNDIVYLAATVKDSNMESAATIAEDDDHKIWADAAEDVDAACISPKATSSTVAGKTNLQVKAAQNSASSTEQAHKSADREQRPIPEKIEVSLLLSSVLLFLLRGIM